MGAAGDFVYARRKMLALRRKRDSIECEHGIENQCRGWLKFRGGVPESERVDWCAACKRWYEVALAADRARREKDTVLRRLDREFPR